MSNMVYYSPNWIRRISCSPGQKGLASPHSNMDVYEILRKQEHFEEILII